MRGMTEPVAATADGGLRMIDTHLHFWDPTRLRYPWLEALPALLRPFRPDDLETGVHTPVGAVFVEAGGQGPMDEVAWVESLARSWPVRGIVAQAPLERGAGVFDHLAALAARPLVRGVRRNVQDEPPGFALADDHVAGVRRLAEHGLTADLCLRHHQLPEVTDLVRRVPEVTFVLDHLAKPDIRAGGWEPWRTDLARLADLPNVACKLSGLTTEAASDWRPADIEPYLRHGLAVFGPDRCMVGSDWPVVTLAADYAGWCDLVAGVLAGRPAAERAAVLVETATRVYRLAG
jgi:L-fuconolactonase